MLTPESSLYFLSASHEEPVPILDFHGNNNHKGKIDPGNRSHNISKSTFFSTSTATMQTAKVNDDDDVDWINQEWLVKTQGEPARIYFAHVGKTGGTSLEDSILLDRVVKRRALSCLKGNTTITMDQNNRTKSETGTSSMEDIWFDCLNQKLAEWDKPRRASSLTTHLGRQVWMHKHTEEARKGSRKDTDARFFLFHVANTFLFTARNPLARVISAFNYHNHYLRLKNAKESSPAKEETKKQENPTTTRLLGKERPLPESYRPNITDKKFLLECFRNMNDIAEGLKQQEQEQHQVRKPTSSSSVECLRLARQILSGQWSASSSPRNSRDPTTNILSLGDPTESTLQHFYHNYQYYLHETIAERPDVPVVVIRTEHLWDDVRRLNNALIRMRQQRHVILQNTPECCQQQESSKRRSDVYNEFETFDIDLDNATKEQDFLSNMHTHDTHGSEYYASSADGHLSHSISTVDGRRALCCAIYKELEAYQTIILRALNLNAAEKYQTLQQVMEDCGVVDGVDENNDNRNAVGVARTVRKSRGEESLRQHPERQKQQQQQQLPQRPFSWSLWHNQSCSSSIFLP